MRAGFLLDPEVAYFNHGSFGACPVEVFDEYQRLQRDLEREPTKFFRRRFEESLREARGALAAFVGARTDDLVFTPNATAALNAVIRSLRIRPEEEILTTKHEYGAILRTLGFIRANVVQVEPEELVAKIGIRTRAIVVSHITSPTALVLPVRRSAQLRARQASSRSSTAHMRRGTSRSTSRQCGPTSTRGTATSGSARRRGQGFSGRGPSTRIGSSRWSISWGYHEDADFGERHGWQGTNDPSAYLAVPKAIEVHAAFDLAAAAALADEAERRLSQLGLKPLRGARSPLMRALTVRTADPDDLWRRLYDEHRVELPVYEWEGTTLARVSDRPLQRRRGRRAAGRRAQTHSRPVIQSAIQGLLDGRDLARDEAREVMGEIMGGEATPAQIGGFLVALRAKGETADEIAGCAEAMRAHVLEVHPTRDDVVDVVGTGGDGARTFNISTTAAIVAAAAGAAVAKHGNRAVSSVSGSADVLEALGFTLEQQPERIAESIDTLGFGFMFAPAHHPAMRHAAPVRRELGTRTIFNVLGPLTNPAGARAGVFGVYSRGGRAHGRRCARRPRRAPRVRRARRGRHRRAVSGRPEPRVRGRDGAVRERVIDPAELGIAPLRPGGARGRVARGERARRLGRFCGGAPGAKRAAVTLNAAGAIAAAGHAADLAEGLAAAEEAIDSGRAAARLEELVAFSQQSP